ncbi:MAG: hypothetical protein KJO47_07510 [Gammaproteobacteria bacterium]|nr:hypothetical protein [Gammaproteobacteria bacterium]
MKIKKYIAELKRRHVIKSSIAYLVVAWLITQVASIILPVFEAPPYIMKVLLFILAIGFPISVILAWIYDVTPKGLEKTKKDDSIDDNSSYKNRRLNRLIIGSLLITVILLLVNLFSNNSSEKINESVLDINAENKSINEHSIAVLPLLNLNSKNENLEYFSDGMTQEIIDELAKVDAFTVSAFTQSIYYKNHTKPPKTIAQELNVKYLISGSVRLMKDSLKLSIELFNPKDIGTIWRKSFNESLDKAPSIQKIIAENIVQELDIELSVSEQASLNRISTTSGEAFKLFLEGKAETNKLTQNAFNKSEALLLKAIEIDPNYAQAHTQLAFNYILRGCTWFGGDRTTSELKELIDPHVKKSIELNSNSSDAFLVRANRNLFVAGLMMDAKRDVDHALKINSWPKVPTNYCFCIVVSTYVSLGDYTNANKLAKLGRKVDPGNVFIYWDQANIYMQEGKMKEAQALYQEAIDVLDHPFFVFSLGWSYYHDNNFTVALKHLQRAHDMLETSIGQNTAYLSNVYYKLGNIAESDKYKKELLDRINEGEYHLYLPMAMISAARNEKEETIRWLEKAFKERESTLAYMMNVDPIFKPYYEEPEFINIRKEMQYYDEQ